MAVCRSLIAVLGIAAFLFVSTVYESSSIEGVNAFQNIRTENNPVTVHTFHRVWVTAYSSTPEETDTTPFITASGEQVYDGVVAANFLPFGTKMQIPEFFGDKIFEVKDRMHHRKTNFVDVWMPSKEKAQQFGIHKTTIVVLNESATRIPIASLGTYKPK